MQTKTIVRILIIIFVLIFIIFLSNKYAEELTGNDDLSILESYNIIQDQQTQLWFGNSNRSDIAAGDASTSNIVYKQSQGIEYEYGGFIESIFIRIIYSIFGVMVGLFMFFVAFIFLCSLHAPSKTVMKSLYDELDKYKQSME